jgi:hypothetical protein
MEDTASVSLVVRRFGSWSDGKNEAEIQEDLSSYAGRSKKYTKEDVVGDLKECAERNDGKCTVSLLSDEEDLVSPTVAIDRFDSWSAAKKAAGLKDERESNFRPRKYDDEDFLDFIRKCDRKHGTATQRKFDEDDEFPSAAAVRKRFGSWSEAKSEAEVEQTKQKYTKEELLDALCECERQHDSVSANTFAADDDLPSPETLQRRFGSWSEAKKEAGVGRYADE